MKISIIIVNYNSSENTIKLLESLKNQTDGGFEIVVMDNASEEADFNNLNSYYTTNLSPTKGAFVIRGEQNLGYSGGNNIGIKKALENGADWVLLLNNDTWVESLFIEHLKAKLGGKEGIVGLVIDEGNRVAYAGQIQWLKPTLIHTTPLNGVSPQVIHKDGNNAIQWRCYVIGGAMAIQKNVFEKIGFLDEKYFLYFEDADFTIRAKKAGVRVNFLSEIKVQHSVSSSTKKLGSPMLLRYHYRNALYFNLKNGPWYIKLLVWPWSWLNFSKQIFKIIIKRESEASKAILLGIIDFYLGRFGKIVSSI